jgi:uncharacterized protein YkwD
MHDENRSPTPRTAEVSAIMAPFSGRFLPLATVPVLAALAVGLAPAPAHAKATVVSGTRLNSSEAALLSYMNKARRDAGLAALRITPGTTDVARRWSLEMARSKKLRHNPSFGRQVGASGSPQWSVASENVGYASACDPKELFDAYMDSPGHRKNILDRRMRYVGIGSIDRTDPNWSCGVVWNTMNFVDSYSTKYGVTREPAWGLRVDKYRPAGSAGIAGFESGPDVRMQLHKSGTLAKSTVAFDKPTKADDAARLTFRSAKAGSGAVSWKLRDAWALDSVGKVTVSARLQTGSRAPSVVVEVRVADHFARQTYLGTIRVTRNRVTKSFTVPSAARGFGNTLELRVTNDAVRRGRASGTALVVHGAGVA